MKLQFSDFKIIILVFALVAGFAVKGTRAQAAETQILTVAGGCFWCVEADFERVKGVKEVVSGYTGGTTKNPTYREVTRGESGHYEAVQIIFDPDMVNRTTLLTMFLRSVDPTDAGGQFCDRGEAYRTAIFVNGAGEKTLAESAVATARAELGQTIVTPILAEAPFYAAEDYHQDYYKGQNRVITRFGAITQAQAYKRYREGCGRDQRVRQLWGDQAPFVGG